MIPDDVRVVVVGGVDVGGVDEGGDGVELALHRGRRPVAQLVALAEGHRPRQREEAVACVLLLEKRTFCDVTTWPNSKATSGVINLS